jgi:hypothetical protein
MENNIPILDNSDEQLPTGYIPEGNLFTEQNNTVSMEYVIDNTQWNMMTQNAMPSQSVELLNMLSHENIENKTVKQINEIHRELLKSTDSFDFDKVEIDEEIKNHENTLETKMKHFHDLMNDFEKQHQLLLEYEIDYKNNYNKSKEEIDKINDFKTFINSVNLKYKGLELDELNKTVLETVQKIKEESETNEINKKYKKQNYIVNLYIQKFLKQVNGSNIGNTCSLCLQRPVDTFMEPCGHTGCSQCIERLRETNSEYDCNCFLCRKRIMKFHKLYFT